MEEEAEEEDERERVFLQRLCEVLVGEMVFQLTTLMYLIFSMLLSQSRLQQTSLIGRAAEPTNHHHCLGRTSPLLNCTLGAHCAPLMGIFYQFDPALDWGRNLNFSPLA